MQGSRALAVSVLFYSHVLLESVLPSEVPRSSAADMDRRQGPRRFGVRRLHHPKRTTASNVVGVITSTHIPNIEAVVTRQPPKA